MADVTTTATVLTGLGEGLGQPGADPLAGHLHQPQTRHLADLVTRAITAQALDQTAQQEVAVARQHHVDEVDDDDAAEVAQAKLPDDLLGRLQVVAGDGFLQVATSPGELAGVDINDGHRLGPIDHQRSAARQEDLAFQRLADLLVEAELRQRVALGGLPLHQPIGQLRRDPVDVAGDLIEGVIGATVSGDDQLLEVLGEGVADEAQGQIGLGVQLLRRAALLGLLLDLLPMGLEPLHVADEFLGRHAFGGGAHDDRGVLRDHAVEHLLETVPFGVRELAAYPGQVTTWRVDDVASGDGDMTGEPGSLGANWVLADLDQYRLSRLEDLLHLAGIGTDVEGIPVDLTGIQHGVSAASDVDEDGLHAREHVLNPAQVDVADQ